MKGQSRRHLLQPIEGFFYIINMVDTREMPMTVAFFGSLLFVVFMTMLRGMDDCKRGKEVSKQDKHTRREH